MSKLIPGLPKIINNCPKNQTTKQKMQRFPSPTLTARLQNIIPNNRRLLNSAPEHAEFPNSGAKTTLKEKMITSLHTAMTETTLHLTLIAHFEQSFPCKKPIFHSKPHNKSMLWNSKGKPNHFPPNSFISLLSKSLPSFRADIRTPLRGSPYWFITFSLLGCIVLQTKVYVQSFGVNGLVMEWTDGLAGIPPKISLACTLSFPTQKRT
jgi:hypothetical protein